MREQRLEKKFVYNQGDESYKYFLISGMFNEAYQKRIINYIYFDTDSYQYLCNWVTIKQVSSTWL